MVIAEEKSHHGRPPSGSSSDTTEVNPSPGPLDLITGGDEKPAVETTNQDGTRQIINISLSDPAHPNNWSKPRKAITLSLGILTVLQSAMGSSLPSNAVTYITAYFHVTSDLQAELPISCFLIGYVFGPLVCGPLSEQFGRRNVMLWAFGLFTVWSMACAVAPTWGSFLFFRFCCGLMASAPIACVSGIFADINANVRKRGQAMATFMVATCFGPVCGPPLSGFIAENTTWRWVFGVATLFAVATCPVLYFFLPETYVPTLSSRRAARLRKDTGNQNIVAAADLEGKSLNYILSIVMTRPFRMLFQEVIVSSTCTYLALAYGIFYLYFSAYPIIFLGPDSVYKWSPGIAGLAFFPIALGALIAGGIFLWWDAYLAAAQEKHKPWSTKEEYRRLPLALIGGPFYGIAMIWLGWASRPGTFWLAPVASGVMFGTGYILIFIALLNYLSDAYMTFAASAQGMASTCRSLLGVFLPLATHQMFKTLGISWACSLLGFLSLLMCGIPILFLTYGEKIRANSKFCQQIHRQHQKAVEQQQEEQQRDRPPKQDV